VYQELLKLKPDSELKIVGSSLFGGGASRYGKECQQQIDSLKAAGAKAEILGYVHNAKLPDLYNWASLFCSFSRDEAFGMTYIEALACKTLVLANRVGGVSEAVGFEEMLITDNLSASEIVNRILDLSNHYMGSYLKAESYSRTIQLFSWDVIARQHSRVLSVSVNM
jgi:glycosyltransferase involved in cell wall biosynthesis